MINKLQIKNYQSHKDSAIELVPGLNVFLGDSRQGKTAIKRSLEWARFDRPIGFANVSFWDRDKKNHPKTEQSVSIELSDGTIVKRIRIKQRNGYDVTKDGETMSYDALNKKVPEDILNILNLEEINFQGQLEEPFMISKGSAEIGRVINQAVDLEKIDETLSFVEDLRKKTNTELKNNSTEIEKREETICSLSWIDKAEKLLSFIDACDVEIYAKTVAKDKLADHILEIEDAISKINQFPKNISEIDKKFEEIDLLNVELQSLGDDEEQLRKTVEEIDRIQAERSALPDEKIILKSETLMDDIERHNSILSQYTDNYSFISDLVRKIEKADKDIKDDNAQMNILISQLPKLCPTCGKPLEVI